MSFNFLSQSLKPRGRTGVNVLNTVFHGGSLCLQWKNESCLSGVPLSLTLSDDGYDVGAAHFQQSANECLMRCFQAEFGGVTAEAVGVQGDTSQKAF